MTHILLIDCQEKPYSEMERQQETLIPILQIIKTANLLSIPITCTEQSATMLGSILSEVEDLLPDNAPIYSKHTFSCMDDLKIKEHILNSGQKKWVLIGLKAHICILQTAKALVKNGFDVIVPNDAIGASNLYQLSSSIAEMRDSGVRITCTETLLLEWLGSDQHKYFNEVNCILNPTCSSCI